MEQQVKTIRISGGEVLVSPMVEPVKSFDAAHYVSANHLYLGALDEFNASFVKVENPIDLKFWWYPICGNSLTKVHDGDYPALEGLTMEVKHLCPNEDSFCEVCNCKQVATVKFTPEPSKAEDQKPDFETGVTLQAKIDFYRNETSKLRDYLEVNRIGKPTQGLFDALYDHVNDLQQEITRLRDRIAELEKDKDRLKLIISGKTFSDQK